MLSDQPLIKRSHPMSDDKGPSHRIYTLLPRKSEDGQDEKFWLKIGSAFEHSDQKGFNLVLEALPLDGKLVLREIKEPEPQPRKGREGRGR